MYHFFLRCWNIESTAVKYFLSCPVISFAVVLTCFVILIMTALWGCGQGTEEQNTERLPVSKETAYNELTASTLNKQYGKQVEHGMIETETYSGSHRSMDQSASPAAPENNENLSRLIAEINKTNSCKKAQMVHEIWILAADMGVPEEALEALGHVAFYESDLVVAERAAQAVEDLLRLKDEADSALFISNSEITTEEHYEQDQLDYEIAISAAGGKDEAVQYDANEGYQEPNQQEVSASIWVDELEEQALWDPYEENRYDAIQKLSLYRSDAAVDILLQAAMDVEARNRFKALETLWFSAADGMDKEGMIWLGIRQALGDSDERVVELAAKALADLNYLEAARTETETALPSKEELTLDLPMYNEDGSFTLID